MKRRDYINYANHWICDIETNKLENPDKIWCLVLRNVCDPTVVYEYENLHDEDSKGRGDFITFLINNPDAVFIGHEFIKFDWNVLQQHKISIKPLKVIDTLIMSKLFWYQIPGGHSVKAWAKRLKLPEQKIEDVDFENYNPKILERCISDTQIQLDVWEYLHGKLGDNFKNALKLEHKMGFICLKMHHDGFRFDHDEAVKIKAELEGRLEDIDGVLVDAFKPKWSVVREVTPHLTQKGEISKVNMKWYDSDDFSIFEPECPLTIVDPIPFNPASPAQIVERLNEAGWDPVDRTKSYLVAKRNKDEEKLKKFHNTNTGWMINETNLKTLRPGAPKAAELLVERLLLNGRLKTLNEWFAAYNEDTKSIHGTWNSIGTWPHRMSHIKPNMGNVPTEKSIKYNNPRNEELAKSYGKRMRSLWITEDEEWLVGTDADAIHARLLVHLTGDERMREGLLNGKKEDNTDLHTMNMKALGDLCKSRDQSKTFFYSWMNGAAAGMVAKILNCTHPEAMDSLDNFYDYYPQIKKFKEETMKKDAERGYFEGLDGRYVIHPGAHKLMAGYLQNGEQLIMKLACLDWRQELIGSRIKFKQRNFVHDEWQTGVFGDKKLAETVGRIQRGSLEKIGKMLHISVPIIGNSSIGKNWYETH